ncbi:MAG: hypothetical protein ACUVWZ_10165 [Anaerolineae bacterium]
MSRPPRTWMRLRPEPIGEEMWREMVRRLPIEVRWELLVWLRRFRRRPERVFWEITPSGEWRRL